MVEAIPIMVSRGLPKPSLVSITARTKGTNEPFKQYIVDRKHIPALRKFLLEIIKVNEVIDLESSHSKKPTCIQHKTILKQQRIQPNDTVRILARLKGSDDEYQEFFIEEKFIDALRIEYELKEE